MRVPLALAAAAARPFLRLPHPAHSRCYANRHGGRLGSTDLQHMTSEGPTRVIGPTGHAIGGTAQLALLTPELVHPRYHRLAASLSGMATCVSRRGMCRVFALINRCFFSYQRITADSQAQLGWCGRQRRSLITTQVRASLRRLSASSS